MLTNKIYRETLECGNYHRIVVCLLCLAAVFGALSLYGNVYVTYVPNYQCADNSSDFNTSHATLFANNGRSESSTPASENENLNQCYRTNNSINLTIDGFEKNLSKCEHWKFIKPLSVESISTEFLLVCDKEWMAPLVTSSQMFGFMIGSVLGGTMSDRLGRRPVYLSSIFLQASSSIAVSLTHNLFVIYIFMFLCGIGMIIRGMVGMVILNEVVPNAHRKYVGILAVLSESLSGVLIPLLAWLLPNWRWMVGSISAALFLIFIPIAMFVGESSKWLLQMKNQKKAKKLNQNVAKICKDNSDTSCECEEINVSPEESSKQHEVAKYTYLDIVKVDFIRRRICILSFAWFAADMAFYGLTFNTNNLGGNRYINSFLSGAVEFPAQFVCFMVVRRIGCRRSFIASTIITSMCLALTPLLHEVNEWAGVVSAMLGKLVITVGYTILFIFTGDLFPTMMRTQSYGACSFMARFGSILVPYILFLGKTVHSSLPYVIMSAISLLSAIAMVFLPETMGLPIPDTLEDARSQKSFRLSSSNENKKRKRASRAFECTILS